MMLLLLLLVGALARFYLHRSSGIKCPPLWHISPIRIQMNAHLQYKHSTRQSRNTHTQSCDTHTHRRDGQSSDNNCTVCRVKAKTTNKMNSQPHREIQ